MARVDDFTRRYVRGLVAFLVIGVLGWAVSLDYRAASLNDLLADDPLLAAYPYPFRVRAVHDGVAELYTPRSAALPAVRFLALLQPSLAASAPDDPAMVAAQQQLARVQQHAKALVEAQSDIDAVRWVDDLAWYERRGVVP